jgi:peptidoglycan/LPS O-acetylase OafA/YrhL
MTGSDHATLMSWHKALDLAPFFLVGLGANRYIDVLRRPSVIWGCALVFAVVMAVHTTRMAAWSGPAEAPSALDTVIGATGALTCLWFVPYTRSLARLGAYSFAIYLFHPFFVAGARMTLRMLELTGYGSLFVVSLLAGLVGPAVLEQVVRRIPVARTAMLGLR